MNSVYDLINLSKHLPKEKLEYIFKAVQESYSEIRLYALSNLAQHYPEITRNTLKLAQVIEDTRAKNRAVLSLSEYLPQLKRDALRIILEIEASPTDMCAKVLHTLAQQLPAHTTKIVDAVLSYTKYGNDDDNRILCVLVKNFPDDYFTDTQLENIFKYLEKCGYLDYEFEDDFYNLVQCLSDCQLKTIKTIKEPYFQALARGSNIRSGF